MRRRNRMMRTSKALRAGVSPGQPAATSSLRVMTDSYRSSNIRASRASMGGSATRIVRHRKTPQSSSWGAGADDSVRAATASRRARISSCRAGNLTQSSSGSLQSGGGVSGSMSSSRGAPSDRNLARRCCCAGQRTSSTSTKGNPRDRLFPLCFVEMNPTHLVTLFRLGSTGDNVAHVHHEATS